MLRGPAARPASSRYASTFERRPDRIAAAHTPNRSAPMQITRNSLDTASGHGDSFTGTV